MEQALGMSYMGKRALVCMKHVGLNVAADPFVNSAITGANGGIVILVADDPSMHSSQDEQDTRFYGKFAMIPTFEPSNQQEAYDMMAVAYDYSEKMHLPVLMRVTTRMAHSRAVVNITETPREQNPLNYEAKASDWVLLPAFARKRNVVVTGQQAQLEQDAVDSPFNKYIDGKDHSLGIITSGIAFNYLNECYPDGVPLSCPEGLSVSVAEGVGAPHDCRVRLRPDRRGGPAVYRGAGAWRHGWQCRHQGSPHGRAAAHG